jgi:hypothetical protein
MFLAVPVIAILRIIVEEFIDYKLKLNVWIRNIRKNCQWEVRKIVKSIDVRK